MRHCKCRARKVDGTCLCVADIIFLGQHVDRFKFQVWQSSQNSQGLQKGCQVVQVVRSYSRTSTCLANRCRIVELVSAAALHSLRSVIWLSRKTPCSTWQCHVRLLFTRPFCVLENVFTSILEGSKREDMLAPRKRSGSRSEVVKLSTLCCNRSRTTSSFIHPNTDLRFAVECPLVFVLSENFLTAKADFCAVVPTKRKCLRVDIPRVDKAKQPQHTSVFRLWSYVR